MEHQSLNKERFKDLENSKKILEDSRREIDQIDSELIDLIQKRTSLAKDIVMAKIALDMDIYDESREKLIYEKIIKIANDKDLNENTRNSIIEIVNILTSLSKSEQKKIIDKNLLELHLLKELQKNLLKFIKVFLPQISMKTKN